MDLLRGMCAIMIDFAIVNAFAFAVRPSVAGLRPDVEPETVEVASLATTSSIFHIRLGVPRIEAFLPR